MTVDSIARSPARVSNRVGFLGKYFLSDSVLFGVSDRPWSGVINSSGDVFNELIETSYDFTSSIYEGGNLRFLIFFMPAHGCITADLR